MCKNIIYEGELQISDLVIPCFVCDDGTRIISTRALQQSLTIADKSSGQKLIPFMSSKALKPLFFNEKGVAFYQPIDCQNGNQKIVGYEAEFLPEFCTKILDARDNGYLTTDAQLRVADKCDILVRGFAKVGIIALIDEATGYQFEREANELQTILEAYIAEELLPWQKRFPDIYYRELFRLNGWNYTVTGIQKRPGVIGIWTNKLIYEQLPPGILEHLQTNIPRNEKGRPVVKFHQLLSDDVGNPHLTAQIREVLTIFQLSDNMAEMWSLFKKLKIRRTEQLRIPFKFTDQGYTDDKNDNPNLIQ